MIIYILVSNFTYFKRKGFNVAVSVSFMFLGQKLAEILKYINQNTTNTKNTTGQLGAGRLKQETDCEKNTTPIRWYDMKNCIYCMQTSAAFTIPRVVRQ